MKLVGVLMVLSLVAAACTKANPRSCKDGSCTDPTLPFCDVSGAIAGEPQTCIAPACTPGEFAECRGDTAVTCNGTGNDYDLVACPRGCDEASGGCTKISCTPGSFSKCEGDSEVVCTAMGDDFGLIPCEHGCDDASGCKGISCTPDEFSSCQGDDAVSCNGLGNNYVIAHCDHGCDPTRGCRTCEPNVSTCSSSTLSTCNAAGTGATNTTCTLGCDTTQPRCLEAAPSNNLASYLDAVTSPPDLIGSNVTIRAFDGSVMVGAQAVTIPSFSVAPAAGAPGVRVFVVNKLELNGASIASGDPAGTDNRAVAFLAKNDALLHGTIIVDPSVGGSPTGCAAGGAGKPGTMVFDGTTKVYGGSGGGGNAMPGARGGRATFSTAQAGDGGGVYGATAIQPLQGGCSSTRYPSGDTQKAGGALQVFSATSLQIDATVDVEAAQVANVPLSGQPGGGAGGSLLLEAPTIALTLRANVDARGGTGASCSNTSQCSAGGSGGTETSSPSNGTDMTDGSMSPLFAPGGGGGGVGRLRINTIDGTYQKDAAAAIHAAATTGTIFKR